MFAFNRFTNITTEFVIRSMMKYHCIKHQKGLKKIRIIHPGEMLSSLN